MWWSRPAASDKLTDVRIVERCVDFIQQAEGARLDLNRPNMSAMAVRPFTASRAAASLLEALAGRLRDDLMPLSSGSFLVEQRESSARPPPGQRAEDLLEILVDRRERLSASAAASSHQSLDGLACLGKSSRPGLCAGSSESRDALELVKLARSPSC